MMKKIFALVLLLVLGKMSYAQYPITQTLGSDSTIVISKGALQSRLINVTYTDTTAANLQRIRQYPGAQIATTTGGLNLWVRNANATAWIPVATGSGNNIYTIDGTLLGNRTLTGAGYSLTFNQLSKLLFNADSTTVNTDQATISNNGVSTLSVKGATGRMFLVDTTAPADERIYELKSSNGEFYISILNDAQTSNDSAFLITSASRVGINTLNPDSTLKVGGGVNILGGLRVGNLPTSPGTKQLRINAQGQLSVSDTLIDAGGTVTSVGTNNGSGITGGPITTTGTLAIDTTNVIATKASVSGGLAGKLNISDTASMLSPYLRSNSAAATYVPLTRTLTINGTTQDLSANRTYNVGTVTSVGLTMPAAFNVANSPVTSSGTLAVTGAGLVSQYIRGDGTLADFPGGGGGGGASISYYLNGSVNQGTFGGNTYYEMNKVPIFGAGTNFSINANGYIAQFITDAGDPGLLNIPAGNWNFELFFNASSSGGSPTYYVELYKYDGTTFTLIASGSTNPDAITGGTSVDAYFSTLPVPQTILTLTDRLAVRIYVTHSGRTITLHTEDNNLCQIITTFTTGITALNGLTEQVQYFTTGTSGTDFNISSSVATHTFNLPTASATNRGALSTTDWTTFNSKLSPADTVSLSNRINLKLNISDTASMLGNYLNNVGYGLSKAGQVASADSATLSAYYLRRKDSLTATNPLGYVTKKILSDTAAAIRSSDLGGTVTSVATNNGTGITGGTITTSGTLAIDTLLVSTRAWRQKGVDSVAALANTKISGSLISGYLTKATGSLTIDTSQIYQNGQNVGIGTIVPDGRLAIVDTGGFALKIMYNSASTDANTNAALYAENNGLSSYVTIFNEKTTNNTGGQFPLLIESSLTSGTAQSGMATGIHFGVPDDAGNRKVTQLAIRTTNAAAATYTNRAELRLWNNGSLSTPYYFLGNGNMGLGTSTPDSNLTVVNGAYFQRGIRASALPQAPGTKALRIDASGTISYADTLIDAGGTVTSVATNNGSGITGGTITGSGTLAIDTLLISTRAWRQKGIDSVAALLPAAISGTTNYIPKFTSSSAIGNSQIFDNGTNVGINNTSPSFGYGTGLQITSALASNLRINTTGYTGLDIIGGANGDGYIYLRDNNPLIFGTNNTERLRISSTGNVSIGNTNNTYKLDVEGDVRVGGSGNPSLTISGSAGAYTGLFYINAAGGGSSKIYANGGSNTLILGTNSTDRATLDASGNLGLGVTPSAWGSGYTALQIENTGFMADADRIWMYANGYFNGTSNLYIQNGFASRYYQASGQHIWENAPSGTAGNTITFTQAMTLDASGNLGLGVAPSAWLSTYRNLQIGLSSSIVGQSNDTKIIFNNNAYYSGSSQWVYLANSPAAQYTMADNNHFWYNAPSGTAGNAISFTQAMTLDASGRLGIGTTSPTYKLVVSNGGALGFEIDPTSSSGGIVSLLTYDRSAGSYKPLQINSEDIRFQTGTVSTEKMRISSTGNVSIGNTNNTYKLDVSNVGGSVATQRLYGNDQANVRLRLENTGGRTWELVGGLPGANNSNFSIYDVTGTATRLTIDASGNLGIGTSSPAAKLDVQGSSSDQIRLRTAATEYYGIGRNSSTGYLDFYGSQSGYVGYLFGGVNGTRMTLDASGNLGLGVSPSAWDAANTKALQLDGGSFYMYGGDRVFLGQNIFFGSGGDTYVKSAPATTYRQYNGQHAWFNAASGTAGNAISFTQAMTLDASGRLGIGNTIMSSFDANANQLVVGTGTTNQGITIYASTSTESSLYFADGTGASSYRGYIFYNHAQDLMAIGTNGSRAITILNSNNVGIGTTSPSTLLEVAGVIRGASLNVYGSTDPASTSPYLYSPSTGALGIGANGSERMRITSGGEVLINTTTDAGAYYLQVNGDVYAAAYYESSDRRLKDILSVREGSHGINTVTFKWKDQRDSLSHIGYIAQDVEKVLPDAVKTNPDGFKTVNYDEVQTFKIAALEKEIAELKEMLKKITDKK